MALIPKCMSTQHPDNAFVPPYAIDGVIKGDAEITEAVEVFQLGCDEQMWDSEGKEADNQVVQKLLTAHSDFFKNNRMFVVEDGPPRGILRSPAADKRSRSQCLKIMFFKNCNFEK